MPILKIQGPILPEMIPDSTLAIRFPVPTTIWCELADGISGLVGRNSPARRTVSLMRWRAVLLARPLAHTPYFAVARWCVSPYLFFSLQTQKIPERAAATSWSPTCFSRLFVRLIGSVYACTRGLTQF